MPGRKETPIFPPGYKAPVTTKPPKRASKAQLSKEFVVESDASLDEHTGNNGILASTASGRKETIVLPPGVRLPATLRPSIRGKEAQLREESLAESDVSTDEDTTSDYASESSEESGGSDSESPTTAAKTSSKKNEVQRSMLVDSRPASSSASRQLAGFEPFAILNADRARATTSLSELDLSGKQIWHITAPNSIPLSSITTSTLKSIENGGVIMTHEGVDYGFVNEHDAISRPHLMLPSPTDGYYRSVAQGFAKTIHLQRISRPPSLSSGPKQGPNGLLPSSSLQPAPPRNARRQPKGLKMRFHPAGLSVTEPSSAEWSSTSGGTSDDDVPRSRFHDHFHVPIGFEQPAQSGEQGPKGSNQTLKRNGAEADVQDGDGAPRRKKRRAHSHDREPNVITEHPSRSSGQKSGDQSSQEKSHGEERERVHKKRQDVPERDEYGRRRETSLERAKRKKKEREQRKRKDKKANGAAEEEHVSEGRRKSDKKHRGHE